MNTLAFIIDDSAVNIAVARLLLQRNHIVVLICASLSELHPSLNTNPRIAAIEVPFPDEAARARLVAQSAPHMSPEQQALVAEDRTEQVDAVGVRPAVGHAEHEIDRATAELPKV